MEFYEKLFQAVKKDDIKQFKSCMEVSNCGSLRLGRFPVLSVMYLYNARRLLHTYEKRFLRHNSWQDIGEPMELSAKFRSIAGKCLRLYLNETVSPVEMLLLLNKNFRLRKVFSQARTTPPVKQRLKNVYYVRWGLQAEFSGNKILLERRPLTRVEKLQWLIAATCLLLCVAMIVATPFVVDTFSRFIPNGEGVVTVTRWEQIRFQSNKTYALQNDVAVSESFKIRDVNCTLIGNGHTVTVKGNGLFGEVNGGISDIIFETNGSPIAQKLAFNAMIDNVTVNANVSLQTDKEIGFLAINNYCDITNVTVNVAGSLTVTASASDGEVAPSFNCGGIVATHNYTVKGNTTYYPALQDCVANYDNFSLQGQVEANAAFGGIVGKNNARVLNCQAKGEITADTFDVAGICAENSYLLYQNENRANITQQTKAAEWNPLAAGIVVMNNFEGSVRGCVNFGAVSSKSQAALVAEEETAPCAYAAGIAGKADGFVLDSANFGAIYAESKNDACAGGIAGTSTCSVTNQCLSMGSITVTGKTCYVGGIWGYSSFYLNASTIYYGMVGMCVADCEINVTTTSSDGFAAVGGIVGNVEEINPTIGNEVVYISSILTDCFFTGKLVASYGAYVGGIAGVVGEQVYLESAAEKDVDKKTFYGNVYLDSCQASAAFGAAFVRESKGYKSVDDKGGQSATAEQIAANEKYKEILQIFENVTQTI